MKSVKTETAPKVESVRYFRMVEHPLKPGEAYQAYQPEIIEVIDDMVVDRKLIDKPNLFEYAQTTMMELVDPRNSL